MTVEPSVDFAHIASSTEGFSGADLQALVYNAHLESIHETFTNAVTPTSEAISVPTDHQYILLRDQSGKAVSKADADASAARVSQVF
jgi:peroxin-1